MQCEQPLPADRALQDSEASFQSKTLYISPLIPIITVLLTKVKLLKHFQEYGECYFLSIAVVYQERLYAANISGTGKKDGS